MKISGSNQKNNFKLQTTIKDENWKTNIRIGWINSLKGKKQATGPNPQSGGGGDDDIIIPISM
jgi:hypothetical protein